MVSGQNPHDYGTTRHAIPHRTPGEIALQRKLTYLEVSVSTPTKGSRPWINVTAGAALGALARYMASRIRDPPPHLAHPRSRLGDRGQGHHLGVAAAPANVVLPVLEGPSTAQAASQRCAAAWGLCSPRGSAMIRQDMPCLRAVDDVANAARPFVLTGLATCRSEA
jgi:hypothetical protein